MARPRSHEKHLQGSKSAALSQSKGRRNHSVDEPTSHYRKAHSHQEQEIGAIYPKTESQRELQASIRLNPITIGSGTAGTGKTLIALYEAVQMYHRGQVRQILYLKPNTGVSFEREIGFLPGSAEEKMSPLLYPILDNLEVFCSPGKAKYMVEKKIIEPTLMEYLRGRSLAHTFLILDECQNTTIEGIRLVVSRMCDTSKLVILGDPNQRDVYHNNSCSLTVAINKLSGIEEVGIVKFIPQDIQRSSYMYKILNAL